MRLLCISDVHGDLDALAAVLAAAERRGYDRLLVAGDHCFPGSDPLGVWRRLSQAGATLVQGVGDRAIATLDPGKLPKDADPERIRDLVRVREALGEVVLRRLLSLDALARIELPRGRELVLVHGSPADPTEPFTHDMSEDEMRALLGDDPADVIVCGGSHIPFVRDVMGVQVVNVGSVGEAICTGGPRHAEATFLDVGGDPWLQVLPITVPLGPLEEPAPADGPARGSSANPASTS